MLLPVSRRRRFAPPLLTVPSATRAISFPKPIRTALNCGLQCDSRWRIKLNCCNPPSLRFGTTKIDYYDVYMKTESFKRTFNARITRCTLLIHYAIRIVVFHRLEFNISSSSTTKLVTILSPTSWCILVTVNIWYGGTHLALNTDRRV
jgi:hypothetical protein